MNRYRGIGDAEAIGDATTGTHPLLGLQGVSAASLQTSVAGGVCGPVGV